MATSESKGWFFLQTNRITNRIESRIGMLYCLERRADLHMVQLMPLPLTVSCFSKIQIGFTFVVPAHPGSPGQRAVKRVCVCKKILCVCVRTYWSYQLGRRLRDRTGGYSLRSSSAMRRLLRCSTHSHSEPATENGMKTLFRDKVKSFHSHHTTHGRRRSCCAQCQAPGKGGFRVRVWKKNGWMQVQNWTDRQTDKLTVW